MIKKYRKKPVVIEAMQFCGTVSGIAEISKWMKKDLTWNEDMFLTDDSIELFIQTLEGNMKAKKGDYIIKGIANEFYPCKPEIFEKTYEEIKE